MPQCQKCKEYLPPNYTEVIPNQPKMSETDEYPQHCIFCKLDVEDVEIDDPHSGWKKYTKKQCLADYKAFLKKVKESKDVQEIMKHGDTYGQQGKLFS